MNKVLINIRRISLVILLLIINIIVVSCGAPNHDYYEPINDYNIFPEEMKGYLKDKKVYLTSIGQSSDLKDTEELILNGQNYFEYESNSLLKPVDVKKDSVVIVFVGCSVKAMAEAEVTVDEELERANDFVNMVRNNEISLICIHIGGEPRRGATSDSFIRVLFSNSVFNIFLNNSDNDGYLSRITTENYILGHIINSDLSLEKVFKNLSSSEE